MLQMSKQGHVEDGRGKQRPSWAGSLESSLRALYSDGLQNIIRRAHEWRFFLLLAESGRREVSFPPGALPGQHLGLLPQQVLSLALNTFLYFHKGLFIKHLLGTRLTLSACMKLLSLIPPGTQWVVSITILQMRKQALRAGVPLPRSHSLKASKLSWNPPLRAPCPTLFLPYPNCIGCFLF